MIGCVRVLTSTILGALTVETTSPTEPGRGPNLISARCSMRSQRCSLASISSHSPSAAAAAPCSFGQAPSLNLVSSHERRDTASTCPGIWPKPSSNPMPLPCRGTSMRWNGRPPWAFAPENKGLHGLQVQKSQVLDFCKKALSGSSQALSWKVICSTIHRPVFPVLVLSYSFHCLLLL